MKKINDTNMAMIDTELAKAGFSPEKLELREKLRKHIITPMSEIEPMRFLFSIGGKPCFARKGMVSIGGKEKCGKTFICSVLMALCFRDQLLGIKREDKSPLRVLWVDTEQMEESTFEILCDRIIPMICESGANAAITAKDAWAALGDRLTVVNIQDHNAEIRRELFDLAVSEYHPDLVILDGIRDLIENINEPGDALNLVEHINNTAKQNSCCIVCVLHQNKGEDHSLRGWLGSELVKKDYEEYECSQDENCIFTFSQVHTRKINISDRIRYVVDNKGIPRLYDSNTGKVATVPANVVMPQMRTYQQLNPEYLIYNEFGGYTVDVNKLFTAAFRPGQAMKKSQLRAIVKSMSKIESDTMFNREFEKAVKRGVIVLMKAGDGTDVYVCPQKMGVSGPVVPP